MNHPAFQQHVPQQAQAFPPALDAVPAEARLSETFPFTPGSLAIGALLGLAGFLVGVATRGAPRRIEDLYLPGGCVLGMVLFGLWEGMRRMRRTSVVFSGDRMGVYRGGKLEQVAYRRQIMIYQLSILNTIRELMAFGILALFALGTGVTMVGQDPSTGLLFLGGGVGLGGAFISSIYARIGCRHFFVPKGDGTEQVMFTRGDAGRFGL